MATKLQYLCEVKEGKMKVVFRKSFEQELKTLVDGDYILLLKRKGKRSDQQNKYYWGVLVAMITAELKRLGNNVDEEIVHEWLKVKFRPVYLHNDAGEVIDTIGGSTTGMNKDEMSEYIDRIIVWVQDNLNLSIPSPVNMEL